MAKKKPSEPKPAKGYGGPVPVAKCEFRCDPPAFPHGEKAQSRGMTLLDYFAGRALTGLMTGGLVPGSEVSIALTAYRVAEAMLQVRKRVPEATKVA